MRVWGFVLVLVLVLVLAAAAPAHAEDAFGLVEGDRVISVGNTFVERDQSYGYLETGLTLRHPGRPILFRNLGWSGDTVFGEARASFDPPPVGFRRLKELVLASRPTVILVGYGAVESFEGREGLPHFLDGLRALLDVLDETRARIVLLSPLRQENLGPPLPDPTRHNADVRLYRDALQRVARDRNARFVDLFDAAPSVATAPHLTDDGLHPTAAGYWFLARVIERGLGLSPPVWSADLDRDGKPASARGTTLSGVESGSGVLRFEALDETLPFPPAPAGAPGIAGDPGRRLSVRGLPPGRYTLKVDDVAIATDLDAAGLARGIDLRGGPELEQVERLRATIVRKNQLYFYRWRPQNETYLLGFRRHEQGRNAAEIVQFDPLIAEQEAAIARLSVPVAHTYTLTKEVGGQAR